MKWRLLLFAVALLLASSRGAEAACSVSSSGVNFGGYNVYDPADDPSTGDVTYRCTSFEIVVQISLSAGSGTYTTRTMKKGAENLSYNLFRDGAFTSVWGDNSGSTDIYTRFFPPTNTDVDVVVYGRITALQDVSVGSYNDTITATINF